MLISHTCPKCLTMVWKGHHTLYADLQHIRDGDCRVVIWIRSGNEAWSRMPLRERNNSVTLGNSPIFHPLSTRHCFATTASRVPRFIALHLVTVSVKFNFDLWYKTYSLRTLCRCLLCCLHYFCLCYCHYHCCCCCGLRCCPDQCCLAVN